MIETEEWKKNIASTEMALVAEAAEATEIMQKRAGAVLQFARRVLAVVRVTIVTHKAKLPNSGWKVVLLAIFANMLSTLRGAHRLALTGHGREVPILTRSALEALITLLFIAKEDSAVRARRWVQFAYITKYKLMKKHEHLFRGPEHRNARRRIRDRARRVERYFPNDSFWASGLGCGSLRHMAEKIGLLWHYDAIYWGGSQRTHASAIGVDSLVSAAPDGTPSFRLGLSDESVHSEMAVYCDLMIRGLEAIGNVVELGVGAIVTDLKSEYTQVFKGDPLSQEIENKQAEIS